MKKLNMAWRWVFVQCLVYCLVLWILLGIYVAPIRLPAFVTFPIMWLLLCFCVFGVFLSPFVAGALLRSRVQFEREKYVVMIFVNTISSVCVIVTFLKSIVIGHP